MTKHLLILGAGVDRTAGIDFPLANTLLADVTRFLDGPGKDVETALRDMLPGLRFSFNSMIARAVDKIATREPHEQKAMVQRVQDAIANVRSISDLKTGMILPGIVNNITAFGCFVDLGIKESGLVHISQLKEGYVSDVNEVVKMHQHVQVKVVEVDEARKRIQLTMIL